MDENVVLYIDDEPFNLLLFTENFENIFHVKTARTCEGGLKMMENDPYIKVVICDFKMPEMSGMDFIRKANEKFPDLYYFLLTGYEITADIQNALDTGLIQQYFRKPFDLEKIKKSITICLFNQQ